MKPLNHDETGCNPISSNCVIWQGPDLDCISLCKGDSVSEVVYKLATEFCTLLDQTNLSNYTQELSCFNLGTQTPETFQELIDFILAKMCEMQGDVEDLDTRTKSAPANPLETVVSIASCFYYVDPMTGDTITTMTIQDYVTAIGNRICTIVSQIITINTTLSDHEIRITDLENEPAPTLELPDLSPACINVIDPTELDDFVQQLEEEFCQLRSATDIPADIYTAVAAEGIISTDDQLCAPIGNKMSSLTGWISPSGTVADAINNIWLTIHDLRCAVKEIQLNCCPSGCKDIQIILSATIAGNNLSLNFTGTIPAGFVECLGTTTFDIVDSLGNATKSTFSVATYINNIPMVVDLTTTPIDVTADLTISGIVCLYDAATNTTCEKWVSYDLVNTAPCPSVTYTSTETTIQCDFMAAVGTHDYTVEIWPDDLSASIDSQTVHTTGAGAVSVTFTGLTANTAYKLRVIVTTDGCGKETECPFTGVSTLSGSCPVPDTIVPLIIEAP